MIEFLMVWLPLLGAAVATAILVMVTDHSVLAILVGSSPILIPVLLGTAWMYRSKRDFEAKQKRDEGNGPAS